MKKNFTDSVLKKIHAKKITPREHSYFLAKTIIQIFAGIAFLAFGMLSIALVWHLIHNFAFVEFIFDSPRILAKLFWFGVPVFWIILSVLLWIVTEQIVRQTKRVYRIPFWVIGIIVLLVQVLGGFILEQSQVGEQVDIMFEQRMEWYQGARRMNNRLERMPENGFLVGTVLEIKSEKIILLNDMTNKQWEVRLNSDRAQRFQIEEGLKIRMIGEMISENEFLATSWRPARKRPPLHGKRNELFRKKGRRDMRPPFRSRSK
jgi:hypothetical protein